MQEAEELVYTIHMHLYISKEHGMKNNIGFTKLFVDSDIKLMKYH